MSNARKNNGVSITAYQNPKTKNATTNFMGVEVTRLPLKENLPLLNCMKNAVRNVMTIQSKKNLMNIISPSQFRIKGTPSFKA